MARAQRYRGGDKRWPWRGKAAYNDMKIASSRGGHGGRMASSHGGMAAKTKIST